MTNKQNLTFGYFIIFVKWFYVCHFSTREIELQSSSYFPKQWACDCLSPSSGAGEGQGSVKAGNVGDVRDAGGLTCECVFYQ